MDNEQIAKYLAGECNEDETLEFEGWIAESDTNRQTFEGAKTLWAASKKSSVITPDTSAQWEKLNASIKKEEPKVIHLNWLKYAAALVPIGLVLTYFLLNTNNNSSENFQYVVNETSQPIHLTFSDQSEVWLRENASIRYSENFENDFRSVELKGEAYFKVTSDVNRPFVVQSGEVEVKVLGTEFNVKENDETDLEVAVYEGRVAFYETAAIENEQIINPNEKAVFKKTSKSIEKSEFIDTNEIAWKTGVLSFESTPLKEVIVHLEKFYQVSIDLDEQTENCTITTVFDNISLKESLEIIELSLDLETEVATGKVMIKGSCE